MAKTILIVESDSALSRSMRAKFEGKGFAVEETADGKGSPELIRRQRPELVVLSVDLSAGQNGYIICGKLKKDDELKATPVVIIGNPDGFAQHKKLKTRADEYVAKPVDLEALVERVGGLIGLPEPVALEVVEDELSLPDLIDEGDLTSEIKAPEEIAVESATEGMVQGDAELDMLDAAFDDIRAPGEAENPEAVQEEAVQEEEISLSGVVEEPYEEDQTQVAIESSPAAVEPKPPPAPAFERRASAGVSGPDLAELRELRSKVTELQGSLDDANARAAEHESRVRELEAEVSAKSTDLEVARSSGGKHDKEFFALRDAGTRKDKEILRLKGELNQKENEIVELQDKQNQLEQATSESSGELARRDAQTRTLTAKAEQLTAERKKIDQQLLAAKEEARGAFAKLGALQSDFDRAQDQLAAAEADFEALRASTADLESKLQGSGDEAAQLRRQIEESTGQLESAKREAEGARAQLESALDEMESTKNQLTSQATAFAEEAASLRKKISDLEEASTKHEERLTKLYGRIKGDEKVREKTKKALSIALQLLEEQPGHPEADDEEAAA